MSQKEVLFLIILSIAILLTIVIGIIIFISQYKLKQQSNLNEKEKMKQQHLQEITETKIEIQQIVMQDIGREIHDNVAQKLVLASIYSNGKGDDRLIQINEIINESLGDLRLLSRELVAQSEEPISLNELIEKIVNKSNQFNICTVIIEHNDAIALPMQKAKFITRILQEFIQNSMKYSKCSEIKIELHKKEDQLSILVQDNGIGFDLTETKDGIGLNNMKKRAEIIGAQYELNSNHHGTSLLLNLEI